MSRILKIPTMIEKTGYETVEDAIEKFMLFKKSEGLRELSIKSYKTTFRKFMKVSNNIMEVESLKQDTIKFITPLSDGSPAKFNIPYSNIKAFFNWLVLQKVLEENPVTELGLKKKKDEGNVRCKDTDDIKLLLGVINLNSYTGLRDYTAILLIMDCGIRPTEIWGLDEKDINFKNSTITVTRESSKTKSERTIPVSAIVLDLLDKMIQVKPTIWKTESVFCTYEGLNMNSTVFARRMKTYSEKANVKITPYSLRHTFAIEYLRNEGNVFTLQHTMGHANLNMTKRYVGINDKDLKDNHTKASPLNSVIQRNTRVKKLFK